MKYKIRSVYKAGIQSPKNIHYRFNSYQIRNHICNEFFWKAEQIVDNKNYLNN